MPMPKKPFSFAIEKIFRKTTTILCWAAIYYAILWSHDGFEFTAFECLSNSLCMCTFGCCLCRKQTIKRLKHKQRDHKLWVSPVTMNDTHTHTAAYSHIYVVWKLWVLSVWIGCFLNFQSLLFWVCFDSFCPSFFSIDNLTEFPPSKLF